MFWKDCGGAWGVCRVPGSAYWACTAPYWSLLVPPDAPRDVRVEVTPASPVREGWEVTLSCHDSANPPSSVYSWSLNGLRLSSSTDKLLLRSAQVHDGGTYHCRATNAVGSVESHPTDLEVYCE